jgi:hypothetical protein
MGDKINIAGDPSIAAGLSNIGALFDPKAQAEGAALLARTRNFDAETEYNKERATQVGNRNRALANVKALVAAGFTPQQIAAMQVTGTDSMADLFGGVRTNLGTIEAQTPGGNMRKASVLLNFGAGVEPDAAFSDPQADQIRNEKAAADLKKSTTTAQITAQGAAERAAAKQKADAVAGGKDERYAFTPEQVNGPVRQAIVDLYNAGSKDNKDFTTLDEGMIRKIIDTQQTLISTGLSTRSSSLNDALGALGLVNSADAKDRFDKTVALEDAPGWGTGDTERVVGITPKKAAEVQLTELIPGDPALETRRFMEIPLESARDMLPQIRDQAEVGSLFKLGNRVYEKVQMPDRTFALVAIR